MNRSSINRTDKNENISPEIQNDLQNNSTRREPYEGERFENLTVEEYERFKAISSYWTCLPDSPCIRQPKPDAISIYKMYEKEIVKRPSDRGRLRKYLGNFTQTPEGQPFLNLFNEYLELLKWPINQTKLMQLNSSNSNEDYTKPPNKLTVLGKNRKFYYHYLMPAFYHLLSWLIDNKRDFAILIRTYGKEGPHILDAVTSYLDGLHPTEKPPENATQYLPINYNIWYLKRNDQMPHFHFYNQLTDQNDNNNSSNSPTELFYPTEIYNLWSRWQGVYTILDDFYYWQMHNYQQESAKPFWFNPNDKQIQNILFDDNIRFDDDGSNGIDLQCLQQSDTDESQLISSLYPSHNHNQYSDENGKCQSYSLTSDDAQKWENIYFVQANLLEIIHDKKYFINKIIECECNLDRIQKK